MAQTNDGTQDRSESYDSAPTTQTTKLENTLLTILEGALRHQGITKPVTDIFNEDLAELTALIQSEASRIALEAIGEDDAPDVRIEEINGIEGEYDWSSPCNQLRAEQRTKLKALTAPEGGKHD